MVALTVRLPDGLHAELKAEAAANARSLQGQIVWRLLGNVPTRDERAKSLGGVVDSDVTGSAADVASTTSPGEDAAERPFLGASLPVPHPENTPTIISSRVNAPSAFRPDPKPVPKKK